MEKIWEYLGEHLEDVEFRQIMEFSPYCEMEADCLSQKEQQKKLLKLNSFYRYEDIFYPLFSREDLSQEAKSWLFDAMFHYLICLEFGQGCNGCEIRIHREEELLLSNVYGERMAEWCTNLTKRHRYLLGFYLERQRDSGASIHIFASAVTSLLSCVVYKNLVEPKTLIVYFSESRGKEQEEAMTCLETLFLPLDYNARMVYQEHLGILGEENTMMIEEITIF